MVSESTPPRRPVLALEAVPEPRGRRPERLYGASPSELALAFSQALDLAEGKPPGHAQRVCYIATVLADGLDATPEQRATVFFAALFHDIGAPLTATDIWRTAGISEDLLFAPSPLKSIEEVSADFALADDGVIIDAMHQHALLGAETVVALECGEDVATAVRHHHERFDGTGYPQGLAGNAIPVEARIVAVADMAESLIAQESSSLAARRRLASALSQYAGGSVWDRTLLDPEIVARLLGRGQSDEFWLGLYASDLTESLLALRPSTDQRRRRKRVIRFAEVFADLTDAKGGHTVGHSRRTADGAGKLAELAGLDPAHVEMIRVAALLHDVGLLGVPARVMAKPDILSVSEMQVMRQHPSHAELILAGLAGFEEIAFWIARHHERPDGRGYPEMLSGDDIPLESRIISVADVYSALTGERPHRGAVSRKDAKQIVRGAAGTQLDPDLVPLFCSIV